MHSVTRPLAAEFIGTFALIFFGAGAGAMLGAGQMSGIALAHGFTIMVLVAAFGDISGGHMNPAITAGLAAAGEFPLRRIVLYWIAQVGGAITAGYCLLYIFGGPVNHLGATLINTQRTTLSGAFVLEAIGTFFLVNTVLHAAVRKAAGQLAPFAIGMTVTICILMFGVLTGGSVNPARTIGPDLAAGIYDDIALYVVAQLVGGLAAGVLYRAFWTRRVVMPSLGHLNRAPAE